jgi:general secretion pathway protein N
MGSSLVVLIGLFVFGLFGVGDAKAQVSTATGAVDQLQDMPAPKPKSAAAGLAAPSATATADSVPSANPLWTIPLGSLTATRERPLFSPSRRPPPPVVVAKAPPPPPPPPKPAEPEKPQLSLVGTVLGENWERIGLFVNPADRNAVRLRLGEDHKGWVLRAVRPRQVVLEKGQQRAVLELPQRDVRTGGLPSPPPSPPLSAAPAAATNVVGPPAPTPPQPIVNPFAENQLPTPPSPPVNPFTVNFQKARLP